ncbi:IclR family transcriptional regulator [Jeotgalibacillus haloalkalitolerans]|uniref:IclR family transcriptional regulator n=1 Tax=Jeotgalibacillus haloalkalitolerans TaxID=3104292 RepID=A0ABU5KJD9_9BACL|nr:IclR family transcriptional regulator [Jeotgalibacillus sp. HH7-29]MDZ5711333.1 IclR family transcriptional regulator [Jeotgalibacillus sp. HH7-29]
MSVKSAVRVMEILELLSEHSEGLTVKEISVALSFPQSSTFNLVQTLCTRNYLIQTGTKQYKLGPKLIHIGSNAMEGLDVQSEGELHLRELMEDVQETVFMAVLSEGELVYVSKMEYNRSIRTGAKIGSRKPLYCTGLGKAFLAFLPEAKRDSLIEEQELVKITENTITSKADLIEQLKQFSAQGYSIDDEENEEGLYCLAAPVFNANNEVAAAISIAGPKYRMLPNKEAAAGKLLAVSETISQKLGYIKS